MATETLTAPAASLCFAIGPYGEDESQTRKWSDFVHEKVLGPAMPSDFTVKRTIDEPRSGRIWKRIQQDLERAPVVIADLTDANPNAYFELGFRHASGKPVVHIARAGTILPFDVRDFPVIFIAADWVDSRGGYFTSTDQDIARARRQVLEHVDQVINEEPPPPPVLTKVYRWQAFYAPDIHSEWLKVQPSGFREEVERCERGAGATAISEASLSRFAEYSALKEAASVTGDGTIFLTLLTINPGRPQLDFGYAAFRFETHSEPVLIDVVDASCGREGIEWIRFQQRSRPYVVRRGGEEIMVTIPGYNYTLEMNSASGPRRGRPAAWWGTMKHPHTGTSLGRVELRAKYGDLLP